MDLMGQIEEAIERANQAIQRGDRLAAIAALHVAKPLVEEHVQQGDGFAAVVTLRAARMSLQMRDKALAQQYATLLLSEVAGEIQGQWEKQHQAGPASEETLAQLSTAAVYTLTFIPFVKPHFPSALKQFQKEEFSSLSFVLQDLRPGLDAAGWAKWTYPADIAGQAHYWAARTLVDYGRHLLDGASLGQVVREAQRLAETSLDLLQDQPQSLLASEACNLLGRASSIQGDLKGAMRWFERAVAVLDQAGEADEAALQRADLAALYIQMARSAGEDGDPRTAAGFYQRAEENLQDALFVHRTCSHPEHLPATLMDLAALYETRGMSDRSLETFTRTWQAVVQAGLHQTPLGLKIQANYASELLKDGQLEEAERQLRQLADLYDTPGADQPDEEIFLLVYGGLGDALRRQKKPGEAQAYLSRASQRLDDYQAALDPSGGRSGLLERFGWVYEALIDSCADLGVEQPQYCTQVFDLVEKMHWRSLTAPLHLRPLGLPAAQTEPLLQEEGQLLQLVTGLSQGEVEEVPAEMEATAVAQRLDEIWTELALSYPDYVAIRRQRALPIQDVLPLLDDQVPWLVEYYLGDELDVSLAVLLHKDMPLPQVVRLDTSLETLRAQVRELHTQDELTPVANFNDLACNLYQVLIKPLLAFIPEGQGVCFVPVGSLYQLPFGALYDGERYLIERNPLVIAPSATALHWWAGEDRRQPQRALFFTANSHARTAKGKRLDLRMFPDRARRKLAPLFAESEIVEATRATRARLLEELGRDELPWDVAHLACHAPADSSGLASRLILAGRQDDQARDLTALDLVSKGRVTAALVTLSASESGLAQEAAAESAGLAQAFLFAGASSVLSSLWYLRQDVSVAMSKRVYELWQGSHSKIEALQITLQEALRKEQWFFMVQPWTHPYLWAAFQLYGDWC